MHDLNKIEFINFPFFKAEDASLSVYEGNKTVPYSMERLFIITAENACKRGFHAHKQCSQLMVSVSGECKVICDDGAKRIEYILNDPSKGLLVPPSIWAEQEYHASSILVVIADMPYDEGDYIRNYDEFLKYRGL